MTITRVGVVGSGPLGQAFAHALGKVGVVAVIGAGGPEKPISAAIAVRPSIETAASLWQAAEEDVVFLSVPWNELSQTLAPIADWESRILIDATNAILPGSEIADLGQKTSSEIVSGLSPGAQVVKAFNMLSPETLAEPRPTEGVRVVFLSGDHLRAKVEVGRLIARLGFIGIDLGGLSSGGRLINFRTDPCGVSA
jgi:predicted dinucleotide-binding enzyme